jgi:peroxiredoxin
MKLKIKSITTLFALFFLTVFIPLQAQENNTVQEPTQSEINKFVIVFSKQITEMMQLKIENVTFKNSKGKKININEFAKFMLQGFSFNSVKEVETKKAIFSINPVKTEIDESKPIVKEVLNLKIGDDFPAFDLSSSENSKISLESLKGKPTFISLYFVTCIPCIQEIPLLNHLQLKKNDSINFLAVTMDPLEDVNKFNEKYYFQWNSLVGAADLIGELGVKTFPTYILLDQNSTIIDIQSGFGSDKTQQVLDSMFDDKDF